MSTIGDWTTEKWIEEDGGASSSISTTTIWKDSYGNTQTTTTSIPLKTKMMILVSQLFNLLIKLTKNII